jgi:hypothetical protein
MANQLKVPALLFATFIFLILHLHKWQRSPKSLRTPSPAGLPIIGHLHLFTDMPHLSLAHLAHKLGPIIHL